jgi:hypothetical protein
LQFFVTFREKLTPTDEPDEDEEDDDGDPDVDVDNQDQSNAVSTNSTRRKDDDIRHDDWDYDNQNFFSEEDDTPIVPRKSTRRRVTGNSGELGDDPSPNGEQIVAQESSQARPEKRKSDNVHNEEQEDEAQDDEDDTIEVQAPGPQSAPPPAEVANGSATVAVIFKAPRDSTFGDRTRTWGVCDTLEKLFAQALSAGILQSREEITVLGVDVRAGDDFFKSLRVLSGDQEDFSLLQDVVEGAALELGSSEVVADVRKF